MPEDYRNHIINTSLSITLSKCVYLHRTWRIKLSDAIHLWPRRQKRGRTRLLARAHRLVRLHGTRCNTAAQCQPHLCPHRLHTLQGTPRSPRSSASHTCPSPHPLSLLYSRSLWKLPPSQMAQQKRIYAWSTGQWRADDVKNNFHTKSVWGFSILSYSWAYKVLVFPLILYIPLSYQFSALRQEGSQSGRPISMGKSKVQYGVRKKGGL